MTPFLKKSFPGRKLVLVDPLKFPFQKEVFFPIEGGRSSLGVPLTKRRNPCLLVKNIAGRLFYYRGLMFRKKRREITHISMGKVLVKEVPTIVAKGGKTINGRQLIQG